MSNDTPPAKKLPLHRRFLPTTVAGKATAVATLSLLLILVVVWILRLFGSQSVRLSHAMTVPRMMIEFALLVIIPAVLYWGIRRWNQVIQGEFPDIDRAWEAGINALQAQGIGPSDYPIFLILGSSGQHVEQGLMEALDTKLTIHGIPDATGVSHALQWYMSSDAIYLFCPGASSLSALMGRWTTPTTKPSGMRSISQASPKHADSSQSPIGVAKLERKTQPSPAASVSSSPPKSPAQALKKESSLRQSPTGPSPVGQTSQPEPYLGTLQLQSVDSTPHQPATPSPASDAVSPAPTPSAPPIRPPSGHQPDHQPMRPAPKYEGTISFDQYPPAPAAKPATAATTQTGPPASSDISGPEIKLVNAEGTRPSEPTKPPTQSKPGIPLAMPRAAGNKNIALPASLDTSDQLPRLRYVCKLLKRVRRPTCGINGAVTLIPFELSRVGPLQLSAIAQSARNDVSTIQDTLGIRCPVTAVLVGLEQDKGFAELVRRLQTGLLSRRLGGRFDLRSRPTPEELNTHSDRLCDAFEDWVYRLFSRDDGLAQQRGNRKLYALTSKIRHELKPRLRIVLGQAFGCEANGKSVQNETDGAFFFSGCYFAASGEATGQPAFVKGVLQDKLIDEQSKVQWTKQALRTHRFFRIAAIAGWIITVILAILVLVKLFSGS